ncbi:hypothetical protein BJ912DRAFT_377800 [Pholiota molesta]|nr:hypothetical protein BJ912DRAFT_377800 [Pholiota molesta]
MESYVLTPEIITLGHDLLAFKRYYVGLASLLAYDYCLTIEREVNVLSLSHESVHSNGIFCGHAFRIFLPAVDGSVAIDLRS